MLYCLVYKQMLRINDGFTLMVGPFKSIADANAWYHDNTPDKVCVIDTICSPEKAGGISSLSL